MVGGLVHDEDVRVGIGDDGESYSGPLASRQTVERLQSELTGDAKLAQIIPRSFLTNVSFFKFRNQRCHRRLRHVQSVHVVL